MKPEIQHLQHELPFAIIGMGLTGEATLRMLLLSGVPRDKIKTFDERKPADFNDPKDLLDQFKPKTLIVSPGIALATPWLQEAMNAGIKIRSELEIATYFIQSERIIAITGSIGKSTTTALIGAAAKVADENSFMGGNFGIPLANYICAILSGKPRAEFIILELSSFQLENYLNLKANVGVLTYLSANHLERYRNQKEYYDTKLSLLGKTTQTIVCNLRGGDLVNYKSQIESQNSSLDVLFVDRDYFLSLEKNKPKMVGDHNLDNLAVSYAVAKKMNWPDKSFQAMLEFPGLSHRLENCGSFENILFLNDSKSTTIDSVLEAVNSIKNNSDFPGSIHLLLGGRDKNLPWEKLSELKNFSRFQFHFFGEYGTQARDKSNLKGNVYPTLASCLKDLKPLLKDQEIVLLSPGGTSLDEFKGFEDRGQFFKSWILSEFNH